MSNFVSTSIYSMVNKSIMLSCGSCGYIDAWRLKNNRAILDVRITLKSDSSKSTRVWVSAVHLEYFGF